MSISIGEDDDSLYESECRQYGHPKRRLDPTGHCRVCGRRLPWRLDPATGKPYARFLVHEVDPEEERRRRGISKPVW